MATIVFLGTGGGRFATIHQTRATGGIYIDSRLKLHIDPGPGSLVMMKNQNIDPTKTDGILISHCHPDHYCDAEVLIEAMTNGGSERRGFLLGSESIFGKIQNYRAIISEYHQKLTNMLCAKPGDVFELGNDLISITPAFHSDPSTIGFLLHDAFGKVAYVPDTTYNEKIAHANKDVRVLIISVTRPLNAGIEYHLCTEDATKLVNMIRPELAVITHFGMRMLKEGAEKQAEWIEKYAGIKTISATDGMKIHLEKEIVIE